MPSEEHYDDSAFKYFVLAVLVIILIPTTVSYGKLWKQAFSDEYKGDCQCEDCKKKAKQTQLQSRKPSSWALVKFGIWAFLWVLFVYLIATAQSDVPENPVSFDPYEILGVEIGSDEDTIRKSYRKLSLQYHPDKNPGEDAQEMFIKIAKAYETLTDPAVREKWERYGNPDGAGVMSVGIALPSWLVDTKNSMFILACYVIFLVIVFPTLAICYWTNQKGKAHNQLSQKTMYYFYHMIKDKARFRKLITILSTSFEYVTQIQLSKSDEPILKKLVNLLPEDDKEKDRMKKKKDKFPPHAIKNSVLFFTQFNRLEKELNESMKADLAVILKEANKLITGAMELTATRKFLVPTVELVQIQQMLTQGVWSGSARMGRDTHLLQLPHVKESDLRHFANKKWKIVSIGQFVKLDAATRREFLTTELNFDDQKVRDVEKIISDFFPTDVELKCTAKVDEEDDDTVTGGAIATLVVDVKRPSHVSHGIKGKEEQPIMAHCPHYPLPKEENWWIILADERTNLIWGLKRVVLKQGVEIKVPFLAPKKAGVYQINVFAICDSYVGFDQRINFAVDVKEEVIPKAEPKREDTEGFYSDEEDDEPAPEPDAEASGEESDEN